MDKLELTAILQDQTSATRRLLTLWSEVPMLLMLDVDWDRGPLVLIGLSDRMMWPLLPPGSLLQLDPKVRTVASGSWLEFERPIYLIECKGRFYVCHAQRRGETLRLLSHNEFPFPAGVRKRILSLMNAPAASVADLSQLNFLLGELYGAAGSPHLNVKVVTA